MSSYKDDYVILTSESRQALVDLRAKIIKSIIKAFGEEGDDIPNYGNYVSPVLDGMAWRTHALFIPADGHSESSDVSQIMDDIREKIRADIIKHNAIHDDKIEFIQVTHNFGYDEPKLTVEQIIDCHLWEKRQW